MIIDTDKLRDAINHRDDVLRDIREYIINNKEVVDFEKCPKRLLNILEERSARKFAEIEAVEKLYTAEIQTV